MRKGHQLADTHPWQPGAWIDDDKVDARDGTTALTLITDLASLPTEERHATMIATHEIADVIVAFEQLWKHYVGTAKQVNVHDLSTRPDTTGLRKFLNQRREVMIARHNAAKRKP